MLPGQGPAAVVPRRWRDTWEHRLPRAKTPAPAGGLLDHGAASLLTVRFPPPAHRPVRMRFPFVARVLATLALAWAAAAACVALHTPLPWMIGPLLATSLVSIAGGPTESWGPLRNAGQWTIGAALGLYFTPEVVALIGGLWWAIVLGIVWALLLGWLFGAWLYRVHAPRMHGVPAPMLRATSYFAGAIGAASDRKSVV